MGAAPAHSDMGTGEMHTNSHFSDHCLPLPPRKVVLSEKEGDETCIFADYLSRSVRGFQELDVFLQLSVVQRCAGS